MGSWTELVMACELGSDTPQQVVDILNCLYSTEDVATRQHLPTPAHPFFEGEWYYWLGTDTAYFPGDSYFLFQRDEFSKTYQLTLRCKDKRSDWYYFLHWIAQYSATQGFVGYVRYTDTPGIFHIYFEAQKAYLAEQSSSPREEITEKML